MDIVNLLFERPKFCRFNTKREPKINDSDAKAYTEQLKEQSLFADCKSQEIAQEYYFVELLKQNNLL
jgi:hypothetical protein